MKTEFIGQGIFKNETEQFGNYLASSLKDSDFTNITIFVAFLREQSLIELDEFITKVNSENRKIILYVGIDDKITSKEALQYLLRKNIECYIYNSNEFIYHPKLYLFEGKRNRIIIGSSNLTKAGLFYNVESSILLDFTNSDNSGLKLLNQIKDYYSDLLDFTNSNLSFLTEELITNLFANGKISTERSEFISSNESYEFDKTKKFKIPRIPELGTILIDDNRVKPTYKPYFPKITDEYLEKWEEMFIRMKKYKEDFGTTTVNKEYKDRTLFGWYRKQKDLFKLNIMPKEHIEKLNSINFYFGDGHMLRTKLIENEWLELLKDALNNQENIGVNHRYKYKDYNLGTFLVGVSQANKKNKKLELRDKIEKLGFNFAETSRDIESTISRVIKDFYSAVNPKKQEWRTRFFKHINKKEYLSEKSISEIEFAWEYHFGQKFTWTKINERYVDRTEEWKEYKRRKGVWYPINLDNTNKDRNLHHWVKRKMQNPVSLERFLNKFTREEINELRECGFRI